MSDGSDRIAPQELERLRLENTRLKELIHQSGRIRMLYEGALEKIRKVETSLSEANAILKAMHHCGQTLLRASGEDVWLQRVCGIIAESTDYKLAWIGYPDDEGKSIRLKAHAGIEAQSIDHGLFCLLGNKDEACPAARAMLIGKLQVIEDIGQRPDCTPWIDEAIRQGFLSSVFLPLGQSGNHIGVLCLYAKANDAFDQDRLKLLMQLAGEISFGISFLREKQQREKAEQELYENEDRMRLAFATAKQAWFDLDVPSGKALLSPEYASIFGYGPNEFENSLQHWKGDLHPEDREATVAALDECLATGGPTRFEYRKRTKSGDWKWVLSVGKVIEWDDEHRPLRLIGIHMDISSRKEMESALLASEEQYRLLFEHSGEAILLGGPDGRIYSANPAACRMFGRSEEELVSLGRPGIVDERNPGIREMLAARGNSGLFHGEVTMLRANGLPFPAELSTVQFTDSHGRQRLSLMFHDISERRRHEMLLQARLQLVNAGSDVDYHELMRKTLDIAEDVTGSKIGFFHFVDDEHETISLQAWSTNTIEKMCTAEAAGMNYKLSEAGVWAEAIRKRTPVIHNDYPHLDGRKGMPEGHAVVEREVCVPLLREGKVVAAIGVGNKPSDYDETDVEALGQLTNLAWDFIEARKAEMVIRESELRYRALFQSVSDYALVLEFKGREPPVIVDANDAAFAKHGYTREEMIGQPVTLIDKETRPEDMGERLKLLMAGRPMRFEIEHTCKDGSTFLTEVSASLVGTGGETKLLYSVERDITVQKLAQEKIRISESRLKEAQEVAHLGSWELDLVKDVLWWSDENYRVFGVEPGKANTYETFLERVHPDDRAYVDKAYTASVRDRAGYNIEHRLLMPDGSIKWVQERCETFYADDGTPLRSIGTTMDISKRKKADEVLRQRINELERFTKAAVRREFRIKELKEQIAILKDMQADDRS